MISNRERRRKAQEHLAAQREKVEQYVAGPMAPDGYQRADAVNFAIPLVCLACGAAVVDDAASQHSEWHRWLWDHLGDSVSS